MLIQNKQIAIVGGGPSGLTLARILQLNGANVKLYERDFNKDARVQGSPLDMHEESGAAALRKANLFDEFMKNVRQGADKRIIVNQHAEIKFSDHEKPENFESDRPEIDRGALRKIFLEALQLETIVWDSHFISMDKQNEGWLLHFKNDHLLTPILWSQLMAQIPGSGRTSPISKLFIQALLWLKLMLTMPQWPHLIFLNC